MLLLLLLLTFFSPPPLFYTQTSKTKLWFCLFMKVSHKASNQSSKLKKYALTMCLDIEYDFSFSSIQICTSLKTKDKSGEKLLNNIQRSTNSVLVVQLFRTQGIKKNKAPMRNKILRLGRDFNSSVQKQILTANMHKTQHALCKVDRNRLDRSESCKLLDSRENENRMRNECIW